MGREEESSDVHPFLIPQLTPQARQGSRGTTLPRTTTSTPPPRIRTREAPPTVTRTVRCSTYNSLGVSVRFQPALCSRNLSHSPPRHG
jgi:hypothetical protein